MPGVLRTSPTASPAASSPLVQTRDLPDFLRARRRLSIAALDASGGSDALPPTVGSITAAAVEPGAIELQVLSGDTTAHSDADSHRSGNTSDAASDVDEPTCDEALARLKAMAAEYQSALHSGVVTVLVREIVILPGAT